MWKKEQVESAAGEDSTSGNSVQLRSAAESQQDVIAFVGKGVIFKGAISYHGTVRIDGILEGEIHTDGTLIVGEDAVITAKVSAGTIISKGKMNGDIVAKTKISLHSPAVLDGSVTAPLLSMEEGVLFNGTCEMARGEVRELPLDSSARVVNQANTAKRVSS